MLKALLKQSIVPTTTEYFDNAKKGPIEQGQTSYFCCTEKPEKCYYPDKAV